MPLISVLLPVYKASSVHLLLSIASVVLSSRQDLELVVGFDGPAEQDLIDVVTVATSCTDVKARMLMLPRQGLVGTLNALINASDSEYIARQDADDFSLPMRFVRQQQYQLRVKKHQHPKLQQKLYSLRFDLS